MRAVTLAIAIVAAPAFAYAQDFTEADFNRLLSTYEKENSAKAAQNAAKRGELQALLPQIVEHIRTRSQCEAQGLLYLPGHQSADGRGCVAYALPLAQEEPPRSGSKHRR